MMYYAKKVILSENNADDYVFVRVAIPVNSVNSYVLKTIPLSLAIAFFAICCSVTASVFIGSGIGKPLEKVKDALSDIERGVYTEIPPTTDDQEVNAILAGINEVGERLEKNIAGYKGEKEKLDYILNNVSDGIVVIDEEVFRRDCGVFRPSRRGRIRGFSRREMVFVFGALYGNETHDDRAYRRNGYERKRKNAA